MGCSSVNLLHKMSGHVRILDSPWNDEFEVVRLIELNVITCFLVEQFLETKRLSQNQTTRKPQYRR